MLVLVLVLRYRCCCCCGLCGLCACCCCGAVPLARCGVGELRTQADALGSGRLLLGAMKLDAVRARQAGLDLTGKHAVVFGATAGLGRAVAVRLAQANVGVVAVGRNAQAGAEVVQELRAASARFAMPAEHSFRATDASLLGNVRALAAGIAAESPGRALDMLVLSQGIATMQGRTETAEGLDVKMALHYYSRVAAAKALMPMLERSASPRVLSIFAAGVHPPYEGWSTDTELKTTYSLSNAANAAAFYNDIGWSCMSEEHPSVSFVHSAPGFVATSWGTELNPVLRGLVRVLQAAFAHKASDAAEMLMEPLLDAALKPGFHLRSATADPARASKGLDAAAPTVWKHTLEVLGRH